MHVPDLKPFLDITDHSVSKETFSVYRSEALDLLATHPQPLPENLGRYYESDDYISHTDGKRSMFEKLYHAVKSHALKQKCRLLSRYVPKGKLLDIGAGTGDFLAAAQSNGWDATGIEPSDKARRIAASKGLTLAAHTDHLPDASFDVITMWHVLEHVPDPERQMKELKRLMKPNGIVVIAVPNFKSFDAQHYGTFWAAYDVPRHLWHFSRTAIRKIAATQSLLLEGVHPMKFDSFYVSLLSEKYKSGKMNVVSAFAAGLRSNVKAHRSGEYSSLIYVLKNDVSNIEAR